ncbi:hypothetical protein VNO78_13548 [Psophocarpus tetragonolobus]|uniref:Uncharacterized protein n=1 Tax=Psophocarpus tetragonolobus TaxID=3891 RepID=A0AAN9XQI8_PSOTE
MATSSAISRVSVLFLIILSLVVVSSEARLLPKLSTMMTKKINSELFLRDIVNNVRKSEYHHHKRSMLGERLQRLAPAGPDPQHH